MDRRPCLRRSRSGTAARYPRSPPQIAWTPRASFNDELPSAEEPTLFARSFRNEAYQFAKHPSLKDEKARGTKPIADCSVQSRSHIHPQHAVTPTRVASESSPVCTHSQPRLSHAPLDSHSPASTPPLLSLPVLLPRFRQPLWPRARLPALPSAASSFPAARLCTSLSRSPPQQAPRPAPAPPAAAP